MSIKNKIQDEEMSRTRQKNENRKNIFPFPLKYIRIVLEFYYFIFV